MAFSFVTEPLPTEEGPGVWDEMTWEEFLNALPQQGEIGEWMMTHKGVIRFNYLGHHMGVIPAVRFSRTTKLPCDRIRNNWALAADEIRLPRDLGQRIHDAVKNKPGHDPVIRAQILRRIGLRDQQN